ncbi:UspA domain-containing protein [Alkalidesulfovibrio alkalitolerans DSM 16529]|uniref:UspA domain-containing protein n=1 Tax=Alkalidesulfovibrio alkalitolerans DSM 16529 TaxID=1121439 RepID=S7UGH7_9BACT|nr:universal stress protein [Alkalidesulfovibrio alkalitolerans]EPR32929.1 UspA domain-containing protein [Alkalidesulfovibrio alkalitolerans DSM 16529]
MFERILFATTASPTCDDAAKVAFELSKKNKSQLSVFHVFGIPTRGFSTFVRDIRTGEIEEPDENYTALVVEEMRHTYEKFLPTYDQIAIEAVTGEPATEILRKARKDDVNMIIMGAHSRAEDIGATRHRAITGSTMQRVARAARCPVLIVSRPCVTCWSYFANIVVGVDFTKASDSAFAFALNVAKEIGCKLHVFHCIDLSTEPALTPPTQGEVEERVAKARKKMEEKYISKMGDFDNYTADIWEGMPYVEILKFAREHKADLIVLAHHTREVDPEQALLGSTVEQVVLRSACPVCSVNHPDKVDVTPYGVRPAGEGE